MEMLTVDLKICMINVKNQILKVTRTPLKSLFWTPTIDLVESHVVISIITTGFDCICLFSKLNRFDSFEENFKNSNIYVVIVEICQTIKIIMYVTKTIASYAIFKTSIIFYFLYKRLIKTFYFIISFGFFGRVTLN